MSDSVRPHKRQPTRLPRPWDSPGKNTGVGRHFLLREVLETRLFLGATPLMTNRGSRPLGESWPGPCGHHYQRALQGPASWQWWIPPWCGHVRFLVSLCPLELSILSLLTCPAPASVLSIHSCCPYWLYDLGQVSRPL